MSLSHQDKPEPICIYKDASTIHSKVIQALERDMQEVKTSMQNRGLNVDVDKLSALINEVRLEKEKIYNNLYENLSLRGNVNFNSARDIALILSNELGVELKKSRTGRIIANRRALTDFNNPLTKDIARYRKMERIQSSLKGLYAAIDKKQGKVSCIYTDDCPSGRLYTRDYNLQGIPELGRSGVYADEGCSFILADYESFELRILSAIAHDIYFKDCWAKGLDLHRKVVADMKNIPYELITDKERKLGKCLNFGLSYGQEAAGLARNLGIKVHQAEMLMKAYKSNIPEIEAFKQETIKKARSTGFAETYFGRRRFLPDIISSNIANRKKSERQAVNTKIQGTASDILKFSLVKLYKSGFAVNTTLHDSVVITVPNEEVKNSIQQVKSIMQSIEVEEITFPVSCKTGKIWGDCQ